MTGSVIEQLRGIGEEVVGFSREFEPGTLDGDAATEVVRLATEMANAIASVTARAARRVDETSTWRRTGDASAGQFLASRTGGSAAEIDKLVATERRMSAMPHLAQATQSGKVSPHQADEISRAAAVDRSAELDLLSTAQSSSLADLADAARRRRAAAEPDEKARHQRIRAQRCLRTWVDSEGVAGVLWKTTVDQLGIFRAIHTRYRDTEATGAHHDNPPRTSDQIAADAFFEMLRATPAPPSSDDETRRSRAHRDVQIHFIASTDAVRRGHLEPGERCEMAGVGPVPVDVVTRALAEDDPFISILEAEGTEVTRVARPGRSMTAAMKEALLVRDPTCVVPGCRRSVHLEAHHTEPFADTGHTALDELANLCGHHHDLVTHRGFTLDGEHRSWALHPPDTG